MSFLFRLCLLFIRLAIECMELMMKENIAGTEGIAEETQMDGPREEGYSEEKKVKGTDTNCEELD